MSDLPVIDAKLPVIRLRITSGAALVARPMRDHLPLREISGSFEPCRAGVARTLIGLACAIVESRVGVSSRPHSGASARLA
jgi:hypothetical protein